jgi:hypothetical protein
LKLAFAGDYAAQNLTATGLTVTCGIGQTCNPGTGLCQSGPTTVTFQNGANGYGGSADTFIDAALGSQATASPIVIDGTPVEQALLRFDGSSGQASLPPSATLAVGRIQHQRREQREVSPRLLSAWATRPCGCLRVAPWNAQAGPKRRRDAVTATATAIKAPRRPPPRRRHDEPSGVVVTREQFRWVILRPAARTGSAGVNESTTAATRAGLLA